MTTISDSVSLSRQSRWSQLLLGLICMAFIYSPLLVLLSGLVFFGCAISFDFITAALALWRLKPW
ncbi:hypothetical protein [Rouxiella badensis]|uniref:hypothetical protein n=1 Tax=Rouxiella badensis TaxID=1646377 RepID=UPI001787F63A|nr:hypothetical protein H2866_17025 [Rouxiella badensis subsp. acadiensis]